MANNNKVTENPNDNVNIADFFGRRDTQDLTELMSERLMDHSIVERYGTSLKMTMGREYNKYLNERYMVLKKEFQDIDKNSDSMIDFNELCEFFNAYESTTGVRLSKEYIESLYEFMDQDKNHQITM